MLETPRETERVEDPVFSGGRNIRPIVQALDSKRTDAYKGPWRSSDPHSFQPLTSFFQILRPYPLFSFSFSKYSTSYIFTQYMVFFLDIYTTGCIK